MNDIIEKNLKKLAAFLEDSKAVSPKIYKPCGDNAIADAVAIASATSKRQAQGLAQELVEWLKDNGTKRLHTEGLENGEWILVDANDLIIHIFLPETRDIYRLDELFIPFANKESS